MKSLKPPASPSCPPYESVPSVYFHHGQFWAGTPAQFLERLYQDLDDREDDVWLSSYPRSGTAWAYAVLGAALHKGDITALQQAQSENRIPKFKPIEVGIESSVTDRITAWKNLPSPRVIPTHLPYRLFPGNVLSRRRKRVFVVRNPRDVAVSLYHFHRSHRLLGFYKGTWDDFFECFISGQVIYGSWFDHTLGWLPDVGQNAGHVMVLRYEDMQRDLAGQVLRIGAFLDRSLSLQAASAIARHCSFQSMSSNPFTNREGDPIMDFSIARFLRKGIVGDWENYFTEEQKKRFHKEWDRKMGGAGKTIGLDLYE